MTNKDEKTTWTWKEGPPWLSFGLVLGIAGIITLILFPGLVIGLLIFGLFGAASSRETYWKSVGDVRGRNYGDPQRREDYYS